LYSNISKEIAHVIGRGSWIVTDPDYLPYFVWDTSFNSLLASIEDPDGARSTFRTLLSYQLPNGMLPRILNWNHDPEPFINVKNSNPPVASLCAWRIFERWADYSFLEEVYPKLLKWHDWWPNDRDGNGNGLLEWGATGTLADARLETGWDDTPAFDGAEMVGTQMNVDAVDLNALWAMDAECLAKMAEVLGLSADAKRLLHDRDRTNRLMNELLWNEELGVYCHRLWDHDGSRGRLLARLTPMNFYPLISGAPDQSRAKRMLSVLTDPKQFWGSWPIPTLPYNDPEWVRQDYWRGHTWPPVNYLVFQGLKRYASLNEQLYFAKRSVELFMKNWYSTGTCNETYNSSDGKGDRYPHYTWGALLCQIGLEALLNIDPSGPPVPSAVARLWGDFEIRNIPSGGKLYRVTSRGSSIAISEAA
jgi:putative isomerase